LTTKGGWVDVQGYDAAQMIKDAKHAGLSALAALPVDMYARKRAYDSARIGPLLATRPVPPIVIAPEATDRGPSSGVPVLAAGVEPVTTTRPSAGGFGLRGDPAPVHHAAHLTAPGNQPADPTAGSSPHAVTEQPVLGLD
jgi:hypothetical protein